MAGDEATVSPGGAAPAPGSGPGEGDGAEVRIRRAVTADATALAAVEAASFTDPWSSSAFARLLGAPHAHVRVACAPRGHVVGHCILLRVADEGEIANLAVLPGWRGLGIGGRLLDDALAAADAASCERLFLEVRASNAAARSLYAARGFQPVGRRRGYYTRPPEDAVVMRRNRPG